MRGFTLIEVLVAALIIMLGVTGYVTLQSQYVRSDSQLNLRNIALKIGKEKLEDLSRFNVIETTTGEIAFEDIDDNAGGTLAAGEVTRVLTSDDTNTHTFLRSWRIMNQYFVDTDGDGIEDTWLNEGNAGLPSPLPAYPSQKIATVTVTWTGSNGESQNVSISGNIAPVPIGRSYQASNESDNAKQQPQVAYTPGAAPDVISYELGNGEKIETSKPVPDIDNQGDNNIVQFETVKYIELADQTDKLEQEDFLTVNCSCTLVGVAEGKTPSMNTLEGDELVVKSGKTVSKMTGELANTQQPDICTACCRDHHDTADMVLEENYYRLEDGLPHNHYKVQNDGSFVQATSAGDNYDEVCRFKRVNGYFEIFPDWQLLDIIEFNDSYLFDSVKLDAYKTYSEGLISADIQNQTAPLRPADRDMTVVPGGYQFIARGIYLDYMTSEHLSEVQDRITNNDETWKAITPFYDINLTLLSEWSTDDGSVATVTQEDIDTIVDPVNDFYGTYSRGRLEALADGVTKINVSAYKNNAGITGTGAVSPNALLQAKIDNTVTITVDSKAGTEKFFGLIGNINCLITIGGVTDACDTNNNKRAAYVDLSGLTLNPSPDQFNCLVTAPKGKSTPFYSCEDVSENYRGNITFALSKAGYTVVFKMQYPDGTTETSDTLDLSAGLTETSNGEYNVIIELTEN